MERNEIFDKKMADEGIKAVCNVFDDLELTMMERWWVVHCIEVSARSLMGYKFDELARKFGPDLGLGDEPPIQVVPEGEIVEKPAE